MVEIDLPRAAILGFGVFIFGLLILEFLILGLGAAGTAKLFRALLLTGGGKGEDCTPVIGAGRPGGITGAFCEPAAGAIALGGTKTVPTGVLSDEPNGPSASRSNSDEHPANRPAVTTARAILATGTGWDSLDIKLITRTHRHFNPGY